MSITKYSPEDITYLTERLSRVESEIRALKMEDKAHHTAVMDGVFRIIDSSGNERVKLGKISTGVYGIKIYDANGNLVQEITDSAVNTTKIIGSGLNNDGDILFASLTVPSGRKVIFVTTPVGNHPDVTNAWGTQYLGNSTYTKFMLLGTVLGTNFQSRYSKASRGSGHPAYPNLKLIWAAGTYTNIKLYARDICWVSASDDYWENGDKSSWIALEVAA